MADQTARPDSIVRDRQMDGRSIGKKEKIIRTWFAQRFGDVDVLVEKFPHEVQPKEMHKMFSTDVQGTSVSYSMIKGTVGKIMVELGIEAQGDKVVINTTEAEIDVDHDFELDTVILREFGDIEVPLMKTGKPIDILMSDHEVGGGQYGGTVTIVIGESGVGKSTVELAIIKDMQAHNRAEIVRTQAAVERLKQGKSKYTKKLVDVVEASIPKELKFCYASSEMTRNDLRFYYKKSPAIGDVPVALLTEHMAQRTMHHALRKLFTSGEYDVIMLDSYEDTLVKLKESLGWSKNYAEGWLINLMIESAEQHGTAVRAIQHLTKSGTYVGGTFLKHATTAMMELRFDDEMDRYIVYSKNRRGGSNVNKRMYFSLDKEGNVIYDMKRYEKAHISRDIAEVEENHLEELNNTFDDVFNLTAEAEDAIRTEATQEEEPDAIPLEEAGDE